MPRKPPSPLDGLTCTVTLAAGTGRVEIAGVRASQAFEVLSQLVLAWRVAQDAYPELAEPRHVESIGGYAPVEVRDDDHSYDGRVVGFR